MRKLLPFLLALLLALPAHAAAPAATPLPLDLASNAQSFESARAACLDGDTDDIDLRASDLTGAPLADHPDLVPLYTFDDQTRWPDALPEGFDPAEIMQTGRNPGLGIRAVHESGITGQGVGIGIIDQTLLLDHQEYADRLRFYYDPEELPHAASMHGAGVASIALGETCGVAPDALLYFISDMGLVMYDDGSYYTDFGRIAAGIHRLLDLDDTLPDGEKIRVISISIGWDDTDMGATDINAAVARAEAAGIPVISSRSMATGLVPFYGAGRDPFADPDDPAAYGPGLFWAKLHQSARFSLRQGTLMIPMDHRTTASPGGRDEYVHYASGGLSWSAPWLAGLYALCCQAHPDITWTAFCLAARRTAVPLPGVPDTFLLQPEALLHALDLRAITPN